MDGWMGVVVRWVGRLLRVLGRASDGVGLGECAAWEGKGREGLGDVEVCWRGMSVRGFGDALEVCRERGVDCYGIVSLTLA